MKEKNNGTAVITQSGFAVLAKTDFSAIVAGELDGLDAGFDRVKVPSGGATVFEVPSGDGDETESVKEFSGVILYHHVLNAYYRTKYTGGNNPPDCGSFDGINGEGDPGGYCKNCPYNKFGSGDNGSKACKNRRRVYILREGEVFPLLLSLPTGSLKPFGRYIKKQIAQHGKSSAVVTKFSLKKATNANGIVYSQGVFSFDRALTPEEYALIEKLSEQIKSYSMSVNAGFDFDGAGVYDDDIYVDPDTGEIIESPGSEHNE